MPLKFLYMWRQMSEYCWWSWCAEQSRPLSCMSILLSRSYLTGWMAFTHRRWTLDGVSSPASVVKSMKEAAFNSQAVCMVNTGTEELLNTYNTARIMEKLTCHCFLGSFRPWMCWALFSTAWVFTLTLDNHSKSAGKKERLLLLSVCLHFTLKTVLLLLFSNIRFRK